SGRLPRRGDVRAAFGRTVRPNAAQVAASARLGAIRPIPCGVQVPYRRRHRQTSVTTEGRTMGFTARRRATLALTGTTLLSAAEVLTAVKEAAAAIKGGGTSLLTA